ncbi:hypothetical protein ACSSS7_000468 [Eimeria intestinalis]
MASISAGVVAFSGGLRGSRGSSGSSSFIIRQGRIQEVAVMSAEARLKLLMAAGGGGFLQAKAEETETILQQAGPANEVATVAAALIFFTPRPLLMLLPQLLAFASMVPLLLFMGNDSVHGLPQPWQQTSCWHPYTCSSAERLNVKKALSDLKTNIEAMEAEREELNACLALEREKAAIEMALNAAGEAEAARDEAATQVATRNAQTIKPELRTRFSFANLEVHVSRAEHLQQQHPYQQHFRVPTASSNSSSRSSRLSSACEFAFLSAVTAQQDLQAGMRENAENAGRDVQETHLRLENAAAAERAEAQRQRHIKTRQQLKEKQQEMQRIQREIAETLRPKHAAATAAYRAAQQQHTQVSRRPEQFSAFCLPLPSARLCSESAAVNACVLLLQMQQQLQQLQRRAAHSGASTAGRLAAIRQQIREAEQQQRLDEDQKPAKQQKRTALQRELKAAEAAAAEASAAAETAAETVKQTTKEISSLREVEGLGPDCCAVLQPLSDVVERLRQQQGKLSALLQQQISSKAKLQAATGEPDEKQPQEQKAQQQRHRQPEMSSSSRSSSSNSSSTPWLHDVDAEYQRAVEAVGGFCFWHFVVPDAAHALEAVARLKQQQQQQQQQRGGMGLRPQRRCCLSLLPLKEVAEQQRQRQQSSVRRKQQQELAQQLLEQGVAMPLMECIRLSDAAPAAPETSGELELFLRSVFGSVLLVPSLDSQEVSEWNQQGFDCVNLDGDIAFASGAMRGGGTKGGRLTAYFRMREAQKADEKLTSDLKAQQEALKTLQQEQKKLVEQEQILSEEKLKAQLQVEAHVATQQKAKMYPGLLVLAQRAATSLLAVLMEEEEATTARILSAKQLQQTLRRETLQSRPGALTSQEKQQLQQLQQQQQQQQQELQQLLRRVEETAAALSQAEDAVEVSLRRAVERLEREANEAEGEAWDPEATDRLQAEIELTTEKRQQEEEYAAEVETRLRALENELVAARKSQETAEVSLQSLLQQLDGETAVLQQTQHTVDCLKRMQADAASLVAAAAAAAGSTAAAAAARASLAAQTREALHSKLSEIKEKLAEFPYVNRKAVAELATIKDDFAALQRRDSLQEETLRLLRQQLQQLQRRRQQLLQQLLRKVDTEFTSLFSQLVPGGHAKLELVQQDSQSPVMGAEASGLEIRANFRAQANGAEERLSMQRLSGAAPPHNNKNGSSSSSSTNSSSVFTYTNSSSRGQKALAALALLLALQRTDVSEGGRGVGLLLLDEADSALDERHRRLLAAALKASSQSPGCQIILTTFRPELLDCGDRFLLVQQSQRASRLSEMQRAEAQALLADMPRHLQDEALQLVPAANAAAGVAAAASTPRQQPQLQLLPLQG